MTALNRSTLRRLQKLRQLPSVWEGDRRTIHGGNTPPSAGMDLSDDINDIKGDCIIWVDGSEGLVRAMDLVPPATGPEAVVRTLLRAMEYPNSAVAPSRPKKIVVRDREIQFFLRGVLQDLDITVDYEPNLPIIDEIFRGLQEASNNRPPQLPPAYAEALQKIAQELWRDAPWQVLDEEKIIAVELKHGDIDALYVSVLGMLGMEYGILLYRSLESLKTFRHRVLQANNSPESLEQAFLEQDCLFVTFDPQTDEELDSMPLMALASEDIEVEPTFGCLHPLEGMRPVLYEDEAIAVLLALTGLHRFYKQHLNTLAQGEFPPITNAYRLPNPEDSSKKLPVKVRTLPDLANELLELAALSAAEQVDGDPGLLPPVLRDDLIPNDAFYSLGALPWEVFEILRHTAKFHQSSGNEFPLKSDGFPVILIQTSRPKAIALIEALQEAGGVKAICFNPGEDPFVGQRYDLGLLQTHNGDLHLFGEFLEDDPVHVQARKKWEQRCKKTKGYCGLVIAKGVKGAARGNPDIKDMVALFEVRSLSSQELGLGPLELMPQVEFPI